MAPGSRPPSRSTSPSPAPDASDAPGVVLRGHVLHVAGAPTVHEAPAHLVHVPDGALVVDAAGVVVHVGPWARLPGRFAGWRVEGGPDRFILPGFVDAHVHQPQTRVTDAHGGGRLLEWLERCVFPAEAGLKDPAVARSVAREFTDRRLEVGTTAAMVFGSAFPHAQDELFAAADAAGLRMVCGRGVQTVGPDAAAPLVTGERQAVDLVADEVRRWHAHDTGDPATARLQVAVVPRFALSVTPRTLRALGELYDDLRPRGVYVHTHLNEDARPGIGEVDQVRRTFGVHDYLDTYDGRFLPGSAVGGAGLLGRRTVLAHAVHCSDAELARLAATGTSVAHCPTSQLFLGSGTMPWRRTVDAGVTVALGTDVGAGDEWLLPRVANDCYKVHLGEPGAASVALHPAQLLFTATLAGARALDMEHRFGNFDLGKDADLVVVDPQRWPPLARVLDRHLGGTVPPGPAGHHGAPGPHPDDAGARAASDLLFTLLMALREPAVAEVWVAGRRVDGARTR